jgi:hypothetical protein
MNEISYMYEFIIEIYLIKFFTLYFLICFEQKIYKFPLNNLQNL